MYLRDLISLEFVYTSAANMAITLSAVVTCGSVEFEEAKASTDSPAGESADSLHTEHRSC